MLCFLCMFFDGGRYYLKLNICVVSNYCLKGAYTFRIGLLADNIIIDFENFGYQKDVDKNIIKLDTINNAYF